MVFYNKFLKSYVLIDLKMNKLKAENVGQMNLYLNYYENVVNKVVEVVKKVVETIVKIASQILTSKK